MPFFYDRDAAESDNNQCTCGACTIHREFHDRSIPLPLLFRAVQLMASAGVPINLPDGSQIIAPLLTSREMAFSIVMGLLHDAREETGFTAEMATVVMAALGADDEQIDQLHFAFASMEVEAGDLEIDWDAITWETND